MKKLNLLAKLRAAQGLSKAFDSGRSPKISDLNALGMPLEFGKHFKR